ncbi:MAG: protein kinase [Nitrospirota bacterium]
MTTPERFGPYLLLKKIGRGGMAELFLARQTGVAGFERVVAIKRILPHLTEDREFVQMFVNEAKLAAQITHPHIVQIYDFGAVLGTYYMAMEYVMGKSLAAVLAQGQARGVPVPLSAAVLITARIAAGLDHAYRGTAASGAPLGIIHRDISPQNILIGYNGDVKLVDFGIAKAASSSSHTQTGVLKGKLAYLSPEQAWGKAVDHRSDLFALGIVLHEMLTGQRLFKADNEFTTLERVRTADVPVPSAVKEGLPKALDAIVLKTLAKNPGERYATGQAFEDALNGYLRTLSPPPSARDLSEYLRTLFDKDIETDTATYRQVTTITKTTAPPTNKRPEPSAHAERTRTIATPASRSVPAPTPAGRGRSIAIGLGVAAALAVSAVGGWAVLNRSTNESRPTPVAVAPPTEPVVADPRVESPLVTPEHPVAVAPAPQVPAPVPETMSPPPSPIEPPPQRKEPKPAKKPAPVPVTAPRKEPSRVAPPIHEARTVTPSPEPKPKALAPAPLVVAPPATEALKPVAEVKPVAPPATRLSTVRESSSASTPAPQPPPEPAHDEAPLPLLP